MLTEHNYHDVYAGALRQEDAKQMLRLDPVAAIERIHRTPAVNNRHTY